MELSRSRRRQTLIGCQSGTWRYRRHPHHHVDNENNDNDHNGDNNGKGAKPPSRPMFPRVDFDARVQPPLYTGVLLIIMIINTMIIMIIVIMVMMMRKQWSYLLWNLFKPGPLHHGRGSAGLFWRETPLHPSQYRVRIHIITVKSSSSSSPGYKSKRKKYQKEKRKRLSKGRTNIEGPLIALNLTDSCVAATVPIFLVDYSKHSTLKTQPNRLMYCGHMAFSSDI